ncbi:MULE transposase domain-containing protein [Phytophthora infestans]|uniref:MULE transposase domain-containing protein n=1 Tax=Phytophthora infestans TaxID=4787 RepID=A0A8S9TV63_PHYIN|nr:MULE transposase domain-containing protein [Phytophthora infestans]
MEFFDKVTPAKDLSCPFFINVHGKNGVWKITQANFAHNHLKNIGSTQKPLAEGNIPREKKAKRNRSVREAQLSAVVAREILPAHANSASTLSGKAVQKFFKGKGINVSKSSISRIKQDLDEKLHGDLLESYQKLKSYLELLASKNPGSLWRYESESDGVTFKRACIVPNAGAHIEDMNKRGGFLVATTKDYNNHIIPFGFALVPTENYDNWVWFLRAVKDAIKVERITILSDRQKGLISAVAEVFPSAGHRFCLRHIMDNINRANHRLSLQDRATICSIARSDCENDYNLYMNELEISNSGAAEYLTKKTEVITPSV